MQSLHDERERLLETDEELRHMIEQLLMFNHPDDDPLAAQVEASIEAQRGATLRRLRDVEQEMGHRYTEA